MVEKRVSSQRPRNCRTQCVEQWELCESRERWYQNGNGQSIRSCAKNDDMAIDDPNAEDADYDDDDNDDHVDVAEGDDNARGDHKRRIR